MEQAYSIRELEPSDIERLKDFTDRAIGEGYYTLQELGVIYDRSLDRRTGLMCTLLLQDSHDQIVGVRITYPPTQWSQGKGRGLTMASWPFSLGETAYFQSLFVRPDLAGQGFGKRMSLAAIEILKKCGARGVVCHSWQESPHNSSNRYLTSMGFKKIASHPLYWKEVDYSCTRCGRPCLCTADEMYLEL